MISATIAKLADDAFKGSNNILLSFYVNTVVKFNKQLKVNLNLK